MKYTKSALGLLNAQYRSVLKKCLLINLGLFALAAISATPAMATSNVVTTVGTTPTDVATTADDTNVNGHTSINSVNNAGNTTVEVYTKDEIDSGFVAKDGSKGLSSNDFTDAYKTAIDNLGTTYQAKLGNGDVTKAMLADGVQTTLDNADTLYTNLGTVTATAAELNVLDGIESTTAELNVLHNSGVSTADLTKLHSVTATADEINKLAGNAVTAADLTKLSQVTADKDELNVLDGIESTTAELNVLHGSGVSTADLTKLSNVTASADELNILDGATVTTAELNVLDGITATTDNLNVLTGVTGKDTAGIAASGTGSATVLATTQSVVNTITNQAQDATFEPTAANLAAVTIKGALNELGAENAVQNTIIGAAMNANGTANTAALTSKTLAGDDVTNLTAAVNLIGDLSSTGINQNTIAGQIGSITAGDIKDRGVGKLISTNSVGANLQLLDTAIGANVTNTTNGVATTKSVNENIDAVNTALGNVAGLGDGTSAEYNGVSGYNATAAGANLTAAVSKLNQNVHNVLGNMYKTDGTFNNDQLKGTNGFDNDATNTNLTAALKNYANNAQAATGVTYAEDGTVTTAYAARTGTGDYTALADGTSLRVAIEHLDNNIGDAIDAADISARTTGAIAADNTVNANIAALDAAIGADVAAAAIFNGVVAAGTVNENIGAINATIGNITTLAEDNDGGVGNTIGNALSNGGGVAGKPTTVVEALNNIDATLGKIHGLKAVSTLGAGSNLAAGTTVDQHLDSLDQAIGDRTNLASLNDDINTGTQTSVAAGLKAAGDVIGDGQFGGTNYASGETDLSSAVRNIDTNLYRVDREVSELKHDFRAGMASMAAMSALVPNSRAQGDTSLSLGTGAYQGHTAMAIGGFHYINDNLLLNAGVSWSNTSDAAYRIGVTYSF